MRRFLILATGWMLCLPAAARAAGPPEDMAAVLPAETLAYLHFSGADALAEPNAQTALGRMLAEPDVKRLCDALPAKINQLITFAISEDADAVQAYPAVKGLASVAWRRPWALGLVALKPHPGELPVVPHAALVIHTGAVKAELQRHVNVLEAIIRKEEVPLNRLQIGAAQMIQADTRELGPVKPTWGFVGDYFVLATCREAAEAVVGVIDGKAPSLAGAAGFKAAAAKCRPGGPVVTATYADVQKLAAIAKEVAAQRVPPAAPDQPARPDPNSPDQVIKAIFALLDVDHMTVAASAMTIDHGGFRTLSYLGCTKREALMTGFDQKDLAVDELLALVPADATFAYATRFDIGAWHRRMLIKLQNVKPDWGMAVVGAEGVAGGMIGLGIQQGLLDPMGDTFLIYDAPDNGGMLITGITVVLKPEDPEVLMTNLATLGTTIGRMAGQKADVRRLRSPHGEIRYFNLGGVPMPVAPAWGHRGDYVVIALYPQMVEAALRRMDGGLDRDESLLANPDFVRARKLLPDRVNAISYGDMKPAVRLLYGLALPLAQVGCAMAQGEGIDLDVSLMPTCESLTRHMFGAVSATTADADGITWVSHGPLPLGGSIVGSSVSGVAMATSIALPSLSRARTLSKRTVSASNLRGIGQACFIYANENDEQFPPDLQTLVKKGYCTPKQFHAPQDSGQGISYIYLGGTAADDPRNVLAYERPDINRGEGVNVLFSDSHVEWMKMPDFQRALEETKKRRKLDGKES